MRTQAFVIILVASVPGLAASAASALEAEHGQAAQISMGQERKTALNVFQGKIVHEGLEKERGDSGLCYPFDMRRGKHRRQVGVDVLTGRILENSWDGAGPKG